MGMFPVRGLTASGELSNAEKFLDNNTLYAAAESENTILNTLSEKSLQNNWIGKVDPLLTFHCHLT